ncbi:MAG TPA: sigma-70 family RNA polymerase sigma factor, partial [Bryobacteraceae bacterium]|nr:sigma-70 family RNA polymerase sigma factor [Bryobacteraceae bacterium]
YDVESVIALYALADRPERPARTLVEQARDGSRAAFGELYVRYSRMVHGLLLARVPHSEVDDMVQDVFLLALRRLPSLREEKAFPGWLAMIARNQAVDYHRRTPPTAELDEGMLRQKAPEPEAFAVLDTIRALPDAYRETLILRLVEGLTGPEIAQQTGLTADSVRVNLHRGMKMLREKLEGSAAP